MIDYPIAVDDELIDDEELALSVFGLKPGFGKYEFKV